MNPVTVRYTVPVFVTIAGGRITRVVVDDEAGELAETVSRELEEILENEEWPEWEFGW